MGGGTYSVSTVKYILLMDYGYLYFQMKRLGWAYYTIVAHFIL